MADFLGHFNTSGTRTTVQFLFTSHDKDGGAIAPSSAFEAADLRIYKDGSATQRSSANGITMTSPFDSVTGLHHVSIDLTDNSDSGFYAAGSFYEVVLVPDETIDTETVVAVLKRFEIGPPQVNVTQVEGSDATTYLEGLDNAVLTVLGTPAGASVSADLLVIDNFVDGVESTLATIDGKIDTIDNLVDDLESRLGTPSDLGGGATVAANLADIEGHTDDIAAIKAKTDSLTFTVAGNVDANIQYVNDTAVTGNGEEGTEWGPA